MTKDELIERVAQQLCETDRNYRTFHMPGFPSRKWKSPGGAVYDTHPLSEDAAERQKEKARAVVDLMMPPPLVWGVFSRDDKSEAWEVKKGPEIWGFRPGMIIGRNGAFTYIGQDYPTLEAAQDAAQAHADAAWIANTRAAQEVEK